MTTPKEALKVAESYLKAECLNRQCSESERELYQMILAAIPVAELHENTLERIRDHSVGTTEDGPCIECEHMIADAREALKCPKKP